MNYSKRRRKNDVDSESDRGKNEEEHEDFLLTTDEIARLSHRRLKIQRRKSLANKVERTYKGRTVTRIGSWNLLSFSKWKARNLGVREVICMTILENGIGILAVQELAEKGALELIRDELNNPTTPNVKNWKGHRGKWKCVTSSVAGMMYRVSRFDFVLISVHLKATGLHGEDLGRLQKELDRIPDILEAINESMPDEKDIIIAGDFNLSPDAKVFDGFREAGFINAIDNKTFTNISRNNLKGSHTYDNIWILQGSPDQQEYTGRSGVCREGLSHEQIPYKEWEPNGVVSDHCPVWAEFFHGRDYDESTGNEELSLSKSERYKVEDNNKK